jgi:hypothetical protein
MMAEEGGGFNLGGGFVEVGIDFGQARQDMAAFKGELQSYFQGAVNIAPSAGGGMGPVAAGGSMQSPAGGAGMQAGGFAALPPAGGGMAPSAFPSIVPGSGAVGGNVGGEVNIQTGAAEGNVKALTGSMKELIEQFRILQAAAEGGADVGGAMSSLFNKISSQSGSNRSSNMASGEAMFSGTQAYGSPAFVTPGSGVYLAGSYSSEVGPNVVTGTRSQYSGHQEAGPNVVINGPGGSSFGYSGRQTAGANVVTGVRSQYSGRQEAGPNVVISGPGSTGASGDQFDTLLDDSIEDEADRFAAAGDARRAAQRSSPTRRGQGGGGFGIYGAISRATGIPYGGVVVGAYAMHVGGQLLRAGAENNPELAIQNLYQPGTLVNAAYDQRSQELSTGLLMEREHQQIVDAIPLWGAVDVIGGTYSPRQQRMARAQQGLSIQAYMNNAAFEQQGALAATRGNPVEMQYAQNNAAMAPLANAYLAAPNAQNLAIVQRQQDINVANTAFAQQNLDAWFASTTLNRSAYIDDITGSLFNQRAAAAGYSNPNPAVGMGLATRGLAARNSAAETHFSADTESILANIKDPSQKEAERKLRTDAGTALHQSNIAAQEEADYAAKRAGEQYEAGQSQNINAMRDQSQRMHFAAIEGQRNFAVTAMSTYLAGGVYGIAASGDTYGAAMQSIAARRAALGHIPGALQRGTQEGLLNNEEAALTGRHNFELQVQDEGYGARTRAAGAAANYEPLTAQAEIAVARARREVSMAATPAERAKVIATVGAELDTQGKLLTTQRGGQVALDYNGSVAMGMMAAFGVDLTGHGRDVSDAAGRYKQGVAGLGSSPQAPQVTVPELAKLINPILNWVAKFTPNTATFLTSG